MLEKVDLKKALTKEAYKIEMEELETRLGELQRKAKDLKIPIMILFEGWGAAGKGTLINRLILPLDPRGVNVYTMNKLTEDERMRPFLWTFWTKTPSKGRMTILDKSWYRTILSQRVNQRLKKTEQGDMFEDINAFEKQLADDEVVIIKFFLHISKEEQKSRFRELEKNPVTAWRVNKEDWLQNERYEKYTQYIEEMIQSTHTEYAPWSVVEANDWRYASIKVMKTIIHSIENKITQLQMNQEAKYHQIGSKQQQIPLVSILKSIDVSKDISKEEYKKRLDVLQEQVRQLEHEIYVKRLPVVILYEGWDAAGKGGNIKRLTEKMDPRGYEVIPIAAPTELEKSHHYLWRFWNKMPKDGHIAIFDRSWYGRVMVERIEGFCSTEEWQRAYKEINTMEKHLYNHGAVVIKLWLHIDKEEQLQRFEARQQDLMKQWKITEEDWRNREKWDAYEQAVDEMLFRTSTDYAPWTIIESNSKPFARIKVLEKVVEMIGKRLK